MSNMTLGQAIPPAHAVVALQGASRQVYGFTAFPADALPARPGVCIFVRPGAEREEDPRGYWEPLYVCGARAMGDDGAMPRGIVEQARRMGCTHVLARFCDRGEDVRREIAGDLIAALTPALNDEGRRAAA